jgi:hypothetical protein
MSNTQEKTAKQSLLPDFLARMANVVRAASNPSHKTASRVLGPPGPKTGKTEEGAVVEMASVEVAVPEPGVTLMGEKVQVASDGRPEHVRDTGPLNVPNFELTFIV